MEVLNKIAEITERLKNIKERKMDEAEFDFDSLLEEIDQTQEPKNEEQKPEKPGPRGPDNSSVSDNSNDDVSDDDNSSTIDSPSTESPTVEYEQIIEDLNNKITVLKGTIKELEKSKEESVIQDMEVPTPELEFSDETKAFLRDYAALEIETKDLQQRKKELRAEYEEQGVHTKEAIKAWKEYQKNLKETPDEAQEIESIKSLINNDDNLASIATALVD
jgi:DNA repair exonuclease SbcCD ATPase subunit